MPVFYITLRDTVTGQEAESMVTRQDSEHDARRYAEQAIRDHDKHMGFGFTSNLVITTIRQRERN